MYTRCPECSTIFRVTAAQLRAALGEVSCGSCQTTFNALAALTDELPELTDVITLNPANPELPEPEVVDESTDAETTEEPDDCQPENNDPVLESTNDAPSNSYDAFEDEDEADDNLIDTFVDEIQATEFPVEGLDDDFIDTIADDQPDEAAQSDDNLDSIGDEPAEGANDLDDQVDGPGENGDAAEDEHETAWAMILADDDGRFDDRREPETEAKASNQREGEPEEPAYDDHTGYEEILDEDDSAAEPEPRNSLDASLELDEDEANAAEESNAWSQLTSATADANEWASFLTEASPDDTDDETHEPTPDVEDNEELEAEHADESEQDEDDHGENEKSLQSWSYEDDAYVDEDEADEFVHAAADAREERADPLIDYDPEFTPPWESQDFPPNDEADSQPALPKRSIALAGALILALGLQLIHQRRDSLAAHPSWGGPTRSAYAALGSVLYPDWDLSAYRISGSEAVAGRTAPTALDIVAKLTIKGDRPVGMPMIRVELKDRWSNPIASRVFSYDEYLREPVVPPTLLSPGETLPIEISVADPGADALNYVVDVCLPRRTTGLQCQIGKNPFQK